MLCTELYFMIIYGKLVMHLQRRYETDVGSVLLK